MTKMARIAGILSNNVVNGVRLAIMHLALFDHEILPPSQGKAIIGFIGNQCSR